MWSFRFTLKFELRLHLNHSCRYASPEDTGWRTRCINDLTKRGGTRKPVGHAKVRVVENIEQLKTDSELSVFPTQQPGVFHDRQVGAEVPGPMKAIAPLGNTYGGAAAPRI